MRGVKRCQASTGRMKKHCDSHACKVTAVNRTLDPILENSARRFGTNEHGSKCVGRFRGVDYIS
jgi:hypothetical protein